jgi:hypothetical protein
MPLPDEDLWSEDFRGRERDRLLDQVSLGEMSPQEAEDEAKKKGVGPFAVRPDPAPHDPLKKRSWTLAMTLAWIVYRDPSQVMEWDNEFRANWMEWRQLGPGHELRPVTLVDGKRFEEWGAISADPDQTPEGVLSKIATAKAELWSALLEGKITAEAIPAGERRRVSVQAYEWQDMTTARANGLGQERLIFKLTPGEDAYLDPRLPRDAILEIWPSAPTCNGDPHPKAKGHKTIASDRTVEKFARDFIKERGVPPSQMKDGSEFARRNGYQVKAFINSMGQLEANLKLARYQRQGFPAPTSAQK